jgi:hypothetical protein
MLPKMTQEISPSQGRYLHTGQNKHRINVHTDIYALSVIRTYDLSVGTSEGSSCPRPRRQCDQPNIYVLFQNNY